MLAFPGFENTMNSRNSAFSIQLALDDNDEVYRLMPRENGLFVITQNKILRIRTQDKLDPTEKIDNVPVEQSIHIPHGSRDEIVARTIIQTADISSLFFSHDSQIYRSLMDLSWELMNSLLAVRHVQARLETLIQAGIDEIEQDIEAYRSGFSPKPLPITPYLDIEFRSFVTEVRRILNKISELFGILTDAEISVGQFHRAVEWAEKKRGVDNTLTKFLKADQIWIKLWIDVRIAVEHPKTDRYVETADFCLDANRTITLPTWKFIHPDYDMARPQNLLDAFTYCINNLLKLYEDLLVMLTEGHQPSWMGINFESIDEEDRDIICPMRWRYEVLVAPH